MHKNINTRHSTFLALVALASIPGTSQAQVILSNLSGSFTGSGTLLGQVIAWRAIGITTGASTLSFTSLTATLTNIDTVSYNISGGIYADSSGDPGSLLFPFSPSPVAPGATNALITLTSAGATLSPNTSYWFILNSDATGNQVRWMAKDVAPTATGVTFDAIRQSNNGGVSFNGPSSIFSGVEIQASSASAPEPTTVSLLTLGALGSLCVRRRKEKRA